MASYRWLFVLSCAGLFLATGCRPAPAWLDETVLAAPKHLIVSVEGRKGTRLYRPDDDAVPMTEENEATEETPKQRIEACVASWDAQTHIPKTDWRKICEREIKSNE
jgi:hypothetical protein